MAKSTIKLLYSVLLGVVCLVSIAADKRPASLDEIQQLFDLATFPPQRMRIVADIVSIEPKISEAKIASEIKYQNETYKDARGLTDAQYQASSNAIARSHSGTRILHIQEWYSPRYYRLDQTEEGMVSEKYLKSHHGTYRNTYINIDDVNFSPYRSFFIDHELRDVQMSKTTIYARNDLWRVLGLDKELAFPIILALADSRSMPRERPVTDTYLRDVKINREKAELIQSDADKIWSLRAMPETNQENRTRFILRGKSMSLDEPYQESDMEFNYLIVRVGQQLVCMEASLTNHTFHNTLLSKKDGFDEKGFPHTWNRVISKLDAPEKQINVAISKIDLNLNFDDKEVFLAPSTTNYILADLTSGQAVVTQNPLRSATTESQPAVHVFSLKRVAILCVLGLVTLVGGIALIRFKK